MQVLNVLSVSHPRRPQFRALHSRAQKFASHFEPFAPSLSQWRFFFCHFTSARLVWALAGVCLQMTATESKFLHLKGFREKQPSSPPALHL